MASLTLRRLQTGFSLVEMSIVLAILSVVLSGILPYITETTKGREADTTIERLDKIEEALLQYYIANQFIPYPGDPTLAMSNASYGIANSTVAAALTSGNARGGMVPVRTLGLPDEYGFDGWGRRFLYNVDTLSTASPIATGALIVSDGSTNLNAQNSYVIVSHGPNGHGGYTRQGTRLSAGSQNTQELSNCPAGAGSGASACATYDATFIKKSPTSGAGAAATFDDVVRYKPTALLLSALGNTGLWSASGQNVFKTNLNGNVGIGTNAPTQKLHVNGNILRLSGVSANGAPEINLDNGTEFLGQSFQIRKDFPSKWGLKSVTTGNDLGLYVDNNELLGLSIKTGTGNVGVGTNAPAYKFHVNGTTVGNYVGAFVNSDSHGLYGQGTTWGVVGSAATGGGAGVLGTSPGTGQGVYGIATGSGAGVYGINSGGSGAGVYGLAPSNHGVYGLVSPSNAGFYGVWGGNGAFGAGLGRSDGYAIVGIGAAYFTTTVQSVSGGMYSPAYYHTSDARLKSNIQPASGLDIIGKLRGVSFNWKDSGKKAWGVIAQEIEKVLPELISTDRRGIKMVDYDQLIGPMIQAINELHEQNKQLRRELDEVKRELHMRGRISVPDDTGNIHYTAPPRHHIR